MHAVLAIADRYAWSLFVGNNNKRRYSSKMKRNGVNGLGFEERTPWLDFAFVNFLDSRRIF
jgi:hypothetical protein